ncbi:Holliday junction branch migration protein RuvA [Lentilactobacillus sp. SPB1-3]|uniref:Holliday junction branch migration protein RuvA n=1 Tax=Lentilactobacillus terminaliae TaxID=3003483 RepID=A0ACD5DCC7_9LACO|nr:Holliday junction branch migration protein RuvA [Lentilactobacillus sp. SPB1-3]MCZ0977373.1 Holliday junction branch migration protein RuvA [Lentilactobacillus sp. SPB1-3]
MFEFIQGMIVDVAPDHIVVQTGGIGYYIYTADPYHFEVGTPDVRVYVYQSVSENALLLFGFFDAKDKQLFLKLIAVSGIGPKSALAILAGNDRTGLISAVNEGNAKFLTKFPGVGKKTAQQIILDLQGKLGDIEASLFDDPVEESHATNKQQSTELRDAILALSALGYSSKQVSGIEDEMAVEEGLSTDEYLSLGLKLLMK